MTGGTLPETILVKDIRGIGGVPEGQPNAIAFFRRLRITLHDTQTRGGLGKAVFTTDLPIAVRAALLQRQAQVPDGKATDPELWRRLAAMPAKARQEAERRLSLVKAVHGRMAAGDTQSRAVSAVAEGSGVSARTLTRHLTLIEGVAAGDWLPALAPDWGGGRPIAACDGPAWDCLLSDYLRSAKPSFAASYRRMRRVANAEGWTVPSKDALRRRLQQKVDPAAIVAAREGVKALERLYPAQERDKTVFSAMEALNADGRRHDVMVQWPDGEICRPILLTVQDLYSGKILAWRVDKTENKDLVRLAFGDVFEQYGIPSHIYLDNGRGFASKWLTGGMKTRFRFKIKAEEPDGIFKLLGIEVHWVLPEHGQSKPNERAYRDHSDSIDRHPALQGAYLGSNPMEKPEDYGQRAADLNDFLIVVASEIEAHNAQSGRRTAVCQGTLSFNQAFEASYGQTPVRTIAPAQRRLWLMAAEGVTAGKTNGTIELQGNRYWSQELIAYRGKRVVVRFDPQFLQKPVIVETLDGRIIAEVPCMAPVGFNDHEAAREHARNRARFKKAAKEQLKAHRKLTAAEVAAMLPPAAPAPVPDAKVVQPVLRKPANTSQQAPDPQLAKYEENFSRNIERLSGDHFAAMIK